jgi:pyridoxamine 5'-phosphate oxidase
VDRQRLAALRRSYAGSGLAESQLAADPFEQFAVWLSDADAAGLTEPNAMVLASVGADAVPSARTVLLKDFDARGFVFFTNYTSRKAIELTASPGASLVFPWYDLERQVVVVGQARLVERPESEAYFRSRPRDSQLGAWASYQSSVLAGRQELEERYAELAARWPDGTDIPVPDFWGGFRVVPRSVEFWQGRPSRLHDRLRYVRSDEGYGWEVERLSP